MMYVQLNSVTFDFTVNKYNSKLTSKNKFSVKTSSTENRSKCNGYQYLPKYFVSYVNFTHATMATGPKATTSQMQQASTSLQAS